MKNYIKQSVIILATFGLFVTPVFAETQSLSVSVPFHFSKNLALGSTGEDVLQLQKILNANAVTQVAATPRAGSKDHETSAFGPATQAAVKAFQKAKGLPATGFVGAMTIKALNEALAAAHPMLPTIIGVSADTSVPNSVTLTAKYDGGGEKPTVWFAYGVSPSSMTLLSKEIVSDTVAGSTQVTISNLTAGAGCYAVAYAKNSVGTTKSDWVHCDR